MRVSNLQHLLQILCSAVDLDLKLEIAENIRNHRTEVIMRKIDLIVIHCTDTPDYHPSDPAFDSFGVAQVRQWHTRPVAEGGRALPQATSCSHNASSCRIVRPTQRKLKN